MTPDAPRPDLDAAEPHPAGERCYFCATDAELSAAISGRPHPPIDMDSPQWRCPYWTEATR